MFSQKEERERGEEGGESLNLEDEKTKSLFFLLEKLSVATFSIQLAFFFISNNYCSIFFRFIFCKFKSYIYIIKKYRKI